MKKLLAFFTVVACSGWSHGVQLSTVYNPFTGKPDYINISTVAAAPSTLPLPAGATNYIQSTETLQSGATFYVSSGTVAGPMVVGNGSLNAPSGLHLLTNNVFSTGVNIDQQRYAGSYSSKLSFSQLGTEYGFCKQYYYSTAGETYAMQCSETNPLDASYTISTYLDNSNGFAVVAGTQTATAFSVGTVLGSPTLSVSTNGAVNLSGSPGTSGQAFTSGGPGVAPSWTTISGSGGVSVYPATSTVQLLQGATVQNGIYVDSMAATNYLTAGVRGTSPMFLVGPSSTVITQSVYISTAYFHVIDATNPYTTPSNIYVWGCNGCANGLHIGGSNTYPFAYTYPGDHLALYYDGNSGVPMMTWGSGSFHFGLNTTTDAILFGEPTTGNMTFSGNYNSGSGNGNNVLFQGGKGTNFQAGNIAFAPGTYTGGTAGNIQFNNSSGTATLMVIYDTSGYVGINQTNPQAQLEVNGTVQIDSTTILGGLIISSGVTPTVGTCGTTPVMNTNSTNNAGSITWSGAATTCGFTFSGSGYKSAPFCLANTAGAGFTEENGVTASSATFTFSASLTGSTMTYVCVGGRGG